MRPVRICMLWSKCFEDTFENTQCKKVKQMQPVWVCILSDRRFEETYENTQWREVKQMHPMWLCILWGRQFEDTFKNAQWRKTKGSFTVHLLIFFWVGFRWDGHYGPEMGGMDPTYRHPKHFLTHHYIRTEMESLKSPKNVFKNYVLNHFLNWKERESCSSADATSVHIDHSIFAMGFIHIPEIYCNPLPPQMVCTNIRIEWKTLGCTHFP